ncbi:TetR/AcrR family transcriptional regulator [Limibaculum sp. M0105]|uniref:TetR/AcrR family transcriptional regulator n=2 Tax=Thermohalobaculum xanthum TaxID=2753746 RepID=A0A8J7SCH5_9RHOB|nr:TetR/AcrR family transcriptional regulator [Thermohalobaculum xanthum]
MSDMKTATRSNNRIETLLDSAAELFSTRGYQATTMRDIAESCGMRPGSIYYHYPNKEALLVAVYEEGVKRLTARVLDALADENDPWVRLERMLTTHIGMIIEPTAYASVIIRILPDAVPSAEADLVELRDRYEAILKSLVAALPLPGDVDRRLLRLFLIGAVNHVQVWYQPGGTGPAEIAQELVRLFRCTARTQSEGSE